MTVTTDQTSYPAAMGADNAIAPPSELTQAFGHADDRSERLDHTLGQLEETITRLGLKLEPVMTNGQPYPMPPNDPGASAKSLDDGRSQVTRRVHGLAERYDRGATYVAELNARLGGIIEALEV